MSPNKQTYQQLHSRIAELEAQYQTLQDNYDDEVLLCVSVLRTLVGNDYNYCESLVKRADCSAGRKTDTLQFIADVRDGYC